MRIVHFSDCHFQPGYGIMRSQRLAEEFTSALEIINKEKPIDLIIFSGDMIDRGGKGFESMDLAFSNFKNLIIDKILKAINLPSERFVFVCGNHDVERDKDSVLAEEGAKALLKDIPSLDDFIRKVSSSNEIKRIESFNKFHHDYYTALSGVKYYETPFQSNLVIIIDGKNVCISMLNSSWRCWDSKKDKGVILMGQAQIIDSKPYLDKADIRIGVSHHDCSWMNSFERPNLPKLIASNYDMYFCGHTHGSDGKLICRPEGNTFFFTAPGLLHGNLHELNGDYKNGFMVIDYDKDRLKIVATKYQQATDESFQIDKNYAKNGVWEREIPAGGLAVINKQVLEVYDILIEKMPNLNSNLIGYGTSTHAPKTIEEIFVMPTLTYKEQGDTDIEPIKTITIDSIEKLLSMNGNIILYGAKESGKTVLLDKILIEILKNQRIKGIIPVLLNYNSIKSNLLEAVANKWDERTKIAENILNEKDVVLLIDDLDFLSDNTHRMTAVLEFIKKFPKVRIIGTAQSKVGLSYENTELQAISFKVIKIEPFKSKQIRELTCKWSRVDSETSTIRSKIDYIIKAFSMFRIPCTPFSVTLLLWILEKGGECQPSNMALLLDGFITELLKDFNGDFTKDKFDQHNKKRLLANIAYGIHIEEQESSLQGRTYNYTYGSLVKQIENHLQSMELKVFNAKKLAKELIQVGLFEHDEKTSLVYFRFRCFMEYFLAIKMQMSEDFFQFVMEENNYLDFSNELVYYTGLTRDKVSVLTGILSRLENVFKDLKATIDNIGAIDNFFIQRSMIDALGNRDLSFILPEKHNEEKDDNRNNQILENNESKVELGNSRGKKVTHFSVYPKLLLLSMDVLRNTEEIDETGFIFILGKENPRSKWESFDLVVTHSLYYAIASYIIGMRYIYDNKDNKGNVDKVREISTIVFLLPELHEEMLNHHLGSLMLADQMKHMILDQEVNQTSEFQRFVATFMYADLKAPGYMDYIKSFVRSFKRHYIADAIYLKLMQYYYESDSKKLDKQLAELMVSVFTKSHQAGNNKKWKKEVLLEKILKTKQ